MTTTNDTNASTDEKSTKRHSRQTLKDVNHRPPNGTVDAARVFERGGELTPATTDGGEREHSGRTERDDDKDEDDDPAEAV